MFKYMFITVFSHTVQDLAKDASSSGMTAGVSVFVQKSGTLRVTRLGCIHVVSVCYKLWPSSGNLLSLPCILMF